MGNRYFLATEYSYQYLIIIISKFLAQNNDFPAFWLVP